MKEIEYRHICFLVTFILTFSGPLPIFLWGCLPLFIDLWALFILRKLGCHMCCKHIFSICIFFLSSAKDFNFHLIKSVNCFTYLFAAGLNGSSLQDCKHILNVYFYSFMGFSFYTWITDISQYYFDMSHSIILPNEMHKVQTVLKKNVPQNNTLSGYKLISDLQCQKIKKSVIFFLKIYSKVISFFF